MKDAAARGLYPAALAPAGRRVFMESEDGARMGWLIREASVWIDEHGAPATFVPAWWFPEPADRRALRVDAKRG